MNRLSLCIPALILGLAGCATQPASVKAPAPAKPVASAPAAKPAAPAKSAAAELIEKVKKLPEPAPAQVVAISKEAQTVTEAFINHGVSNIDYSVSDTTGFPEALLSLQPGRPKPKWEAPVNYSGVPTRGLTADGYTIDLVERDWTGVILTPVLAQVAKAYVSGIQLSNVEVHPLSDGRVRVWVRLRNQQGSDVPTEVACTFKRESAAEPVTMFYKLSIPAKGSRDVFFVSPGGDAVNYTVLVRKSGSKS